MSRRITGGLVGDPSLVQSIQISPDAKMTTADGTDLTLHPGGSASVVMQSNTLLRDQFDLRFGDSDSSNWVAFQGPATVSSNVTWTLPNADGTNLQALTTNGSGTLSWQTTSVSLFNNTTDSATHFVTFTNTTSDTTITSIRRSSTGLTFQPSTGTLTCTALSATTITETSSIAYKENINPINNALEKIIQLSGVIYDRKDGSRNQEPGLIAEDVEKVIPNVITYKDGKAEGITYTKLVAYLIESIKSLNKEIEELKGVKQ
jgi:hypothetical protein